MPVVPSAVVPSVSPTSNSGLPYQNAAGATPDAFGAGIGRAEQNLGNEIGQFGDVLAKHALKMQDEVNTASANNLFVDSTVKLGQLKLDFDSLQGADRVNALPKYYEDIEKVRQDALQAAPNDDVAKRFDNDFKRRVGYTIVDGAASARTANRQYQTQQETAVKASSLGIIAANAKDDDRFQTELSIGLQKTKEAEAYKGQSDETKAQQEKEFTTTAWATRLQAMSKDDPLRARELLNKNKDAIDGVTQLKLEPIINQAIIQKDTRVQSDKIISDVGTGTMVERLKLLENAKLAKGDTRAGNPQWDYKQMTSGYGTKAQPGDENIPPEQRDAIYTERLKNDLASAYNIVDNFAPGLPKGERDALAELTFNAGQKWTSEGLGQAVRSGNQEEAKRLYGQYVNVREADGSMHPLKALEDRRAQGLSWWNNDTGPATDQTQILSTALDRAKERSVQVFPNDPANQAAYLDQLQSRLVSDNRIMNQKAKDLQLQTRNIVMNELLDDKKNISSTEGLSAAAQQAYESAPAGLRGIFDARMRKNASADVPPTNAGTKRYLELTGLATADPDKYQEINIDNEPLLTRGQKQQLTIKQQDRAELVKRGTAVDGAMKSMHPFLNDAGISDSATDKLKRDQYIQFRGSFEAAMNAEMADKKRKLYPKEITDIGQSLLKETVLDPGIPFIPFTGESKRGFQFTYKDFDNLKSGDIFTDPNGNYRRKP
jgi:hypothetical protein